MTSSNQPSPESLSQEIALAAAGLRAGGLVAFPTETVYGLGALAFDANAVQRVFALKGRPSINPLIVHVADAAMARRLVTAWPAHAQQLADAFWPGPLSLILPRVERLPAEVTAGGPTVAVRCPDHPLTLALLRTLDEPLVGPSANRSGHISPTTAQHVRDEFSGDEVLILDGGPCRAGLESTVLSLASDTPTLLRPGLITARQIESILGTPVRLGPTLHNTPTAAASPGLLARHYAPNVPTRLLTAAEIQAHLATSPSARLTILSLSHSPPDAVASAAIGGDDAPPVLATKVLPMPSTPEAYAAALYAALRDAEATKPDLILIERPGDSADPRWAAVLDRLTRASHPEIEPDRPVSSHLHTR